MQQRIAIIGAGLSGALLAIYLARQGFAVSVYERRSDLRAHQQSAGRSINLAISVRGLAALAEVELLEAAQPLMIPMYGRMIHARDGSSHYQAYGRSAAEHQNSISRGALNCLLLDAAQAYPSIELHFNQRLQQVDFINKQLELYDETTQTVYQRPYTCLLGADGASSAVRAAMLVHGGVAFTKQELGHSYKELTIPPEHGMALPREYLHIWPRGNYMLIALPNVDGSLTCTLFLANEAAKDEPSFANLTDNDKITAFFQQQFADALVHMPTLLADFAANPTSRLATIACNPWVVENNALLIGDAAHALVPFLGQGMNCAFEDCSVLNECIRTHGADWPVVFSQFQQRRQINTNAIAQMALANYVEMRDHVADQQFLLHKRIEQQLMQLYPDQYLSKYTMIAFHRFPYAYAQACGELQEALLNHISRDTFDFGSIDWPSHQALIRDYLSKTEELKQQYKP